MNVQVYWDGNSGAVEHGSKRAVLTARPVVGVSFDTISFSDDDLLAEKVLNHQVITLSEEEKSTLRSYAGAYTAPSAIDKSIEEAKEICTVLTTSETLIEASGALHTLSWYGCITDASRGARNASNGVFTACKDATVDVTVRIAVSEVPTGAQNAFTVVLVKNDTTELQRKEITFEANVQSIPTLELYAEGVQLKANDTLSVKLKAPASGRVVPLRTAFIIDDHGLEIAKNIHDTWYSTVAAMEFTEGVSAAVTTDDGDRPVVNAGTWDATIRRL